MAVKTKDEILQSVKSIIGESTDDNAIELLEDITDTINDYDEKTKEDWKAKYAELDETWKKKYKERFFNDDTEIEKEKEKEIEEEKDETEITFNDIFE
nr:MAG TPA: hypothetical protein [Caudoviricetes sp.]